MIIGPRKLFSFIQTNNVWKYVFSTVNPSYNNSGYNDIFFIPIRSHGINYAFSKPLSKGEGDREREYFIMTEHI